MHCMGVRDARDSPTYWTTVCTSTLIIWVVVCVPRPDWLMNSDVIDEGIDELQHLASEV